MTKKTILLNYLLASSILFISCGPSGSDVHGYINYTEINYYHKAITQKLNNYSNELFTNTNTKALASIDSIINTAITDIKGSETKNNDSYIQKRNEFFAKDPAFKNLALSFLQDYQKLVKEDLIKATELFIKHNQGSATLEDAENYKQLLSNFHSKLRTLDSTYVAQKGNIENSYGDDCQKGLLYFAGNVDKFGNSSPADLFNKSVSIARPILNRALIGNELTSGIAANQEKAYTAFKATIDTALVYGIFLTATEQYDTFSHLDFIKTCKKEWETSAKKMIGMGKEAALKEWEKINSVINSAIIKVEEEERKYAKTHGLYFKNEITN